jgi:nitrite reductase/ring-hydroxylating ferredoxin subunit
MQQDKLDALANHWFPIVRTEEVVPRHVFQAQLLGQELAIWRDDAGIINAWANRCPHRGVRLSIGVNTGTELRCQYHGWRYSSKTGQCTFIPAHPDGKPANVIRATVYGCTERYGFVWANLSEERTRLPLPTLAGDAFTTFRSIHVDAPFDRVLNYLDVNPSHESIDVRMPAADVVLHVPGSAGADAFEVHLRLLPMSRGQTTIHGYITRTLTGEERLEILRLHDKRLTEIRDAIESAA